MLPNHAPLIIAEQFGTLASLYPDRIDLGGIAATIQPTGDDPAPVFSFLGRRTEHPRQVPCHITKTTEETHEIIRASLDRSPMYSGVIEGVGMWRRAIYRPSDVRGDLFLGLATALLKENGLRLPDMTPEEMATEIATAVSVPQSGQRTWRWKSTPLSR